MKSTVTLALAVLFVGSGSMVPGPTAAVAVLTMVAGDAVVVVAVTVNVADPPAARSVVVAMFPDPEAGHEDPAVAARRSDAGPPGVVDPCNGATHRTVLAPGSDRDHPFHQGFHRQT